MNEFQYASSVINEVLRNTFELAEGITISEVNSSYSQRDGSAGLNEKQQIRTEYSSTGSARDSESLQSDISLQLPSTFLHEKKSKECVSLCASSATIQIGESKKETLGVISESDITHWIPHDICLVRYALCIHLVKYHNSNSYLHTLLTPIISASNPARCFFLSSDGPRR